MSHYFADELIGMLEKFEKMDFTNAPNFRMTVAIRDAMLRKGVDPKVANALALRTDVSLEEDALDEQQFARVAELQAALMMKVLQASHQAGFSTEEYLQHGGRMSLKLD